MVLWFSQITHTGNVTINTQGVPVSDSGCVFQPFRFLDGQPHQGNAIVLQSCTTGQIYIPGWDLLLSGDVTLGKVTCKNITVGFRGSLNDY